MAFHIPEIVKKHPWVFGGGALALFLIIYYSLQSSGSGSNAGATTATSSQDAQLAAQENIAGLQAQVQGQVASLQAGVQSQSIAASQDVANKQTDATLQAYLANSNNSLSAVQSNNQTQVSLATVQANEQSQTVDALASIVNAQYTEQENQQNDVRDYLVNLTNNQAGLISQSLSNQATATTEVLNNPGINYQISKGNNASQQSAEGVIESVTGNPYGAAVNASAAGKVEINNQNTTNSTPASIISSIGGAGTSLLTGLFG